MDEYTYLEAYISNLGKYNKGKPMGEWVTFPTTAEQIKSVLERIGIDGKNYEEWHITEYNSDIPNLADKLSEYANLDELNYLTKLLENQSEDSRNVFAAAITHGEYAGNMKDLINLAYNLDCYWLYPNVKNVEDYGYYLIDEVDAMELPQEAKKYFDYKAYGEDTSINEGGTFTEQGYVHNNRHEFTEWYDGRDIPKEYCVIPPPTQTTRLDPDKVEMDAAPITVQTMTPPTEPRPVIPIILNAENPADKMKEITDRLEQGITELFESERYKEYLGVMSKFHNYSFNNTLLIAMQKPDASHIAGFNAWKNDFERTVKKGEKGIRIIAPSPYKIKKELEKIDPQTQKPMLGKDGKSVKEEQEITIPAFKVVAVFDVSQTEGKELPDIAVDTLTGDVDRYNDFFKALEKTSPVPVGFEKIASGAKGYYHLEEKRIALQEGNSELQTLKTLIHEIAHAKLHDVDLNAPITEQENRPDRRTREVEAESIAYTVCRHYGLDTSDYSFGYVAGWSSGKELTELKSSLETIRATAAELINTIDGHIAEIQKEQATERTGDTVPLPDPTITVKDMQEYGYTWDGMLPLREEAAIQLFEQAEIFRLDNTGSEGIIESIEEIKEHDGIFGIEKDAWERIRNAPEQETPTFSIYQLKHGEEMRDYSFEPYERLQMRGLEVSATNYEHIYTAPLENGMTLGTIWERFNIDHPEDFKGHSLSVSDIIVINEDGKDKAHYVDSVGFTEVPEFLGEVKRELPQAETTVKYYSINEEAARRAKEANSFSDYKKGSATAEYRQSVDSAAEIAERQKARVDPMHHEKIDRLLDTYARKLAENMNNRAAIDGRVPSILIAGGSNFPTRAKEKQNNARDKNMGEWQEIQGLIEKIRSTGMGGISADDPTAVQKLEKKLASLEQSQEIMKATNAYFRKHKTLDGCPHLSAEQIESLKADMSRSWRTDPKPFESYALTNNNAEIRRIKGRIEDLKKKEQTAYVGWEFDGGKVEINREDNRLQVFFDDKPGEAARTELKSNGFHWAKSAGAWQRQLTDNAIYATNNIACIQPLSGERPTDLQRSARQEAQAPQETAAPAERENPLATAEKSTEQNYNMIDEQINNTPTVDELEAKAMRGEQISLTELAEAIKTDKARSVSAKTATKEEKPSIRAQLKADKEKAAAQKKDKSKSQDKSEDIERS